MGLEKENPTPTKAKVSTHVTCRTLRIDRSDAQRWARKLLGRKLLWPGHQP